MTVLVDTGVLYGFLNQDDDHHAEAARMLPRIADGEYGEPVILDLVVAELFNIFRRRAHEREIEEAARALLFDAGKHGPDFTLTSVVVSDLAAIAALWREHRKHRLSYTDAALVYARESLGFDAIATFDPGIRAVAPSLHPEP